MAFGGIADAIKLIYQYEHEEIDNIENFDLFNIAKFKKTKDGFEMEIFDRQKAIESLHLLESEQKNSDNISMIYNAIAQKATPQKNRVKPKIKSCQEKNNA